ncbi:phasin family protein [Burkholderiales bacterium]|nr:phasin family protein [Burkholderiales bacterium]
MTTTFDQFSVAQEKTLAKLSELNSIGTSTGSKLVELNMRAMKENSSKAAETALTFTKLKDAKSIGDLQATLQPNVDMVTDYWKANMNIAREASAEFSKIFEDTLVEANSAITENLDTIEKTAYPGASTTASAIKTMMSFANQTFDNAAKTQRQAEEVINSTLASAHKTAPKSKKTS